MTTVTRQPPTNNKQILIACLDKKRNNDQNAFAIDESYSIVHFKLELPTYPKSGFPTPHCN